MPRSPLPLRHGLNSAWVRTPETSVPAIWPTMRDWLVHKIPRLTPERIDQMLAEGRFVDDTGRAFDATSPFRHNTNVFFHRDLPDEAEPPGELTVLHRDERIVVLDKPHFVSTIPRGQHIVHSVVVRARRELDLPELAPAHRLDRLTAGVLLCTTERRWRRAYQTLFEAREPEKTYEAVAGRRDDLHFPIEVESHIRKDRGVLQAYELPGAEPNAHTQIELLDALTSADGAPLGRYLVRPMTGRTHQIRLHFLRLGIPIVNDPLYPVVLDQPLDDFTHPLQLLARDLRFTDPVDGSHRAFTSRRVLDAW